MRLAILSVCAVVLALVPVRILSNQQAHTGGIFTDRSGARHAWSVNSANALTWDREPYMPVGGVFCPRYFAEGQTDANWQADVQALETIKSKGVIDILVDPVVSAADVPAPAWQKLVDHLDAAGFRYGIAFGAGITAPLTGVLVRPANYRDANVREGGEIAWRVSGADSARVVIADSEGTVHQTEEVRFAGGRAVTVPSGSVLPGSVALLFPRKSLAPNLEGSLPDVWAGYDSYRDRLLRALGDVKFGAGLRFFLDPLAHTLKIDNDADNLIPVSEGFRLEWEAFLTRKYRSVDELLASWAILDREIDEYKHAAALIPLWSGNKGVPYMLDPLKNRLIEMDRPTADQSRFWLDLKSFRNESLIYYMNGAADLLKRNIADVPVVYTYSEQHRIFASYQPSGGFDGLGVSAYGRGTALASGSPSAAYSQATENKKPTWLIVTQMADAPLAAKQKPGYESEAALTGDLELLRKLGVKGFFVNGFQSPKTSSVEMLRAPEQIEWLKRYAERILQGSVAAIRPLTLPFPACAAGLISEGPIGGTSVWWVPSLAPGRCLEFGSSYAGYSISLPEGDTTVLWSRSGPRETRFYVPDPRSVQITTVDGRPVEVKANLKKRTVTLQMDGTPLVIRGAGDDLLPLEALDDCLQQLNILLQEAESAKIPVHEARNSFDSALRSSKNNQPRLAFLSVVDGLNKVGGALQPYTWIEAEAASTHNFSEVAANTAASGGGFLSLNTETDASSAGYMTQYQFAVPREDVYMVWAAATPPGAETSPFYWTVDSGDPQTSAQAVPVGSAYLHDRLVWLRLGRVRLRKGEHTLTLRVTERAQATRRFQLSMDSIIVTRYPFTPSGTIKPPMALVPAKPAPLTSRRRSK